jgi:hypothetical protein
MTTRRALDRAFARHPVVGSEPRDDIYGRYGLHPDAFKTRSLKMEMRVWAKSLLRNDRPKPFVIYGRPRSGTSLLVHLLQQVPDVRCEGELFHFRLISPTGFTRRLPKRAGPTVRAFGFKIISYQLMEIQRIRRPLAFFDRIGRQGYGVLHLTRNTWDQTLSLAKAQTSGVFFSKDGETRLLRIDPARFLALLQWNEDMLDYERAVMAHVPHFPVDYDRDLVVSARHQSTVDRICDHLGVASAEVAAAMRRTGGEGGLHKVENMAELAAHVRRSPLAHLVPDRLS